MQTKLIKVSANDEIINEAGRIIRNGGLVAFPTETVYGLGANGFDAEACKKIYIAKGRPSDNPLILHVANFKMIEAVASDIPLTAEKLFAAFCPGPLTVILPKSKLVPMSVTGGLDTVGVRMPDNDIARALIRAANCPIAAPSANLSGRPSPTTAETVFEDLNGKIPLILDGGACDFGVESTIIDVTSNVATILRPGAITKEMIEEIIGKVNIDTAIVDSSAIPKAPGMKYRHYAPKVPMNLIEYDADINKMIATFRREIANNKNVGVIASSEVIDKISDVVDINLTVDYGRRNDLRIIAANLYEALRSFDDKNADLILAESVDDDGLGFAIMNRLYKASGFSVIRNGGN